MTPRHFNTLLLFNVPDDGEILNMHVYYHLFGVSKHQRDRRTDRQTDTTPQYIPRITYASRVKSDARPTVTYMYAATEHHRPLADTNLYCLYVNLPRVVT